MTCRVLCFASSIKGKTLAMFQMLLICCVCESSVRSRGICLHTHLGLSKSRLMSRTWRYLRLLFQEFKEIHKQENLWLLWIKERSSPWTWSCHVVMVVSFLLKVAIGCQWSKSYCTNFNSFIVDLFYLKDSQIKSSLGFYLFGFPGLSYRCVNYFFALFT